jgi:hypothetical protein
MPSASYPQCLKKTQALSAGRKPAAITAIATAAGVAAASNTILPWSARP